jgi:hypothetical protein
MERGSEHSQRGQTRGRTYDRSYVSSISSFKDFQNSKLSYTVPEKFSQASREEKLAHWKKELERLLYQQEKLCFHFSDRQPQ